MVELSPPLAAAALRRVVELALVAPAQESWRAEQPSSTQAQIQGFESAHPNIHPVCELLELMKGPLLQIQSRRISMTQGSNRRSERSPVIIQY